MRSFYLIVLLAGACVFLSSTESARNYADVAANPKTVEDLFETCPFLGLDAGVAADGSHGDNFGDIDFNDEPLPDQEKQFTYKSVLLHGVPIDYKRPISELVDDEKNAYIHVVVGDESHGNRDELTFVYFERADKSRIVALRVNFEDGEFPLSEWAFYDVKNGKWSRIPDAQILPPPWEKFFLPRGVSARDRDLLSVNLSDIDLPEFGTTAHFMQVQRESDHDGPDAEFDISGTNRSVRLDDYQDWFSQYFEDSRQNPLYLELKWNKASGRFDAGKLAAWVPPSIPEGASRKVSDVLANPGNVWEYFLSCPALHYHEGVLEWDDGALSSPVAARQDWMFTKQDLLAGIVESSDEQLSGETVDIPNGYIDLKFSEFTEDDNGKQPSGERELTFVTFQKDDGTRYVAFRLWYAGQPDYGFDRTTVKFFRVQGSTWQTVDEADLIPVESLKSLGVQNADADSALLQRATVWDVIFPRIGTRIDLIPFTTADEESDDLAKHFGSDEKTQAAFTAFVRAQYTGRALALNWDQHNGKFVQPSFVNFLLGDPVP